MEVTNVDYEVIDFKTWIWITSNLKYPSQLQQKAFMFIIPNQKASSNITFVSQHTAQYIEI